MLYVAKIVLHSQDRYIYEDIFKYLHLRKSDEVSHQFKYIIDFPKLQKQDFSNQINVFFEDKEQFLALLKSKELYAVLSNHCEVELQEVNLTNQKDFHTLTVKKENEKLNQARIRRLIKREKGEIYKLYKENNLTVEEIFKKVNNSNTKLAYIKYSSFSNHNKAHFFLEMKNIEDAHQKKILDFDAINGFGLGNHIIIPTII